ncbi:MAG: hypothetical protein ACTSYB_11960 [Candidatus Helarchaeota archaeon]
MVSTRIKVLIPLIAVVLIIALVIVLIPKKENCEIIEPYYHKIYSATSTDGLNWVVNTTLLFDHASVPGAVYYNNKIYLYFVNAECGEKLSVAISDDNGSSFIVYDVKITGSNSPRPVDPNPILDGGQIRLTYVGNLGDPPQKIVTALSSDGINFIEEAVIFTGEGIVDPDLFKYGATEWILFCGSPGNHLIKANSSSAAGTFVEDTSFNFTAAVPSTHFINGKYYTYHIGSGPGICVAEYNSSGLTVIGTDIIKGFSGIVADPTVVILGPGDYIMYFKQRNP